MSINPPIQVTTTTEFDAAIRQLAKRYRRIRIDIKPIIEQLEAGELPGDQIPNIGYTIFKVRVRNSSAQRGKSGGYRTIYYLKTADQILLITIYSKSDQADIAATEIREIIQSTEADRPTTEDSEANS
jgi:mRNA-degrading endonuclease RelE of RelBE toxin-antitoxin system